MAERPPEQEPFTRFDREVVTGLLAGADFPCAPSLRRLFDAYDALLRLEGENERMRAVLEGDGWLLSTEVPSEEWFAKYRAANPEAEDEQHAPAEHLREAREVEQHQEDCFSCGENDESRCPTSKRKCGHHCNHLWSHDSCCWCGTAVAEERP